jgi:hypothetical protein
MIKFNWSDVKMYIDGVEVLGVLPIKYDENHHAFAPVMPTATFESEVTIYKDEIEALLKHYNQKPPLITSKMRRFRNGMPLVLGKRKDK